MHDIRSTLASLILAACVVPFLVMVARAQTAMPQGRTGPGGSNQAAGPSGQHPGQVGEIPTVVAKKAAVFDFQLANLGQLPPTRADQDRLPRISDELRREMADSKLFQIVPLTPAVKAEVDNSSELRSCGGCAGDFAKQVGAQVAITGEIQKVSALILNLNVYIATVDGSKPEQAYSVDLRGDTDESFDRAVKYIVKEVITPRLIKSSVK